MPENNLRSLADGLNKTTRTAAHDAGPDGDLVDRQVRSGIQAIEETLAKYGNAADAPAWLQTQFNQLEQPFGISAKGAGLLTFGHAINNEEIVGASGTDVEIHQYTDLANALYSFADAYAAANTVQISVPPSTA